MSGKGPGPSGGPGLRLSEDDLTRLADDLHAMQDHLDQQVRRMDTIVDSVEAGWEGPAASAYRKFHRAAAEDAVRIREVMKLIEEAVRLGRDGFSESDLDVLDAMRKVPVDMDSEVGRLSTRSAPPVPRSRLEDI
nr:WXG100 family type VII secretion target [Streptomyces smaragdinus]